ncbi:MAG: histidine triad nucleotide-binding protein [Chloroflexota bacterium]
MEDCIFCKIAQGKLPSNLLYQDNEIIAFRDIHPKAPTHVLIIPRKHIATVADLTEADMPLVGKMCIVANKIAAKEGIAQRGYRLLVNYGADSGMVVRHLHLHLLGGQRLIDIG